MPRKKSQVEKSLLAKGFRLNQTHHHYFIYYDQEGKKTTIKTKTSHTGKIKDIPDNLLAKMAKQCHLTKSEFLALIDCPLSREEYENQLYEQGVLKSTEEDEM
ncbi:MAG: hypothetical protein AB4080_13305 [Trichodesmium sp.]